MKSEKEYYNYNNSEQSFLDETTLLSGKSGCGQKQLNFIFSIVAAYYMAAQTCPGATPRFTNTYSAQNNFDHTRKVPL